MALSTSDMDRILSEETYRMEVRQQINALFKPRSHLWSFLNSAFGLWLLSALFISGAGNLYQQMEQESENRTEAIRLQLRRNARNLEAIERLDIEISYRLSNALLMLRALHDKEVDANASGTALDKSRDIIDPTNRVLRKLYRVRPGGLYPEHTEFALPTLLVELRRRVSKEEQQPIEASLAKLAEIGTDPAFEYGISISRQAATKILNDVVLERWKTKAFHFIDCPPAKPFC